jgi:hypothetical protein
LKDIAVSTVELALLRERKESLFTTIDTPNLQDIGYFRFRFMEEDLK